MNGHSLSWIDVIWAATASACFTLGSVHALVWWGDRKARHHLLFALAAIGTASYAPFELWMMRAASPEDYGLAVRWSHLPAWLTIVSLVGFVRLYFAAGRMWLAWLVVGLRTAAVVVNFMVEPNLNFSAITGLEQIRFVDELAVIGRGSRSPWTILGQSSLLLLVVFVVDATRTAWRRDRRPSAWLIGGTVATFASVATIQSVLFVEGVLHVPLMASLYFTPVIVAMGYQLSREALRSGQLAFQLDRSEARFNLAAEGAGFGVWTWGGEDGAVWGSAQWLQLFGFEDDEPLSFARVIERVHPDDRLRVESSLRKAMKDRVAYAEEFRVCLADGSERWISSRGRMFEDGTGKGAHMIGASTDITARMTAEREISEQRARLTQLSRVGMLGELSGSFAHELNQPLTAILSNAQAGQRFLALPHPDLEELAAILEDIVAEDRRAGEVIRRLRIMFSKGEVERQPLVIGDLLAGVIHLLRNDLINRGVTTRVELEADLPVVHADLVGLQQVLINLVMNACDAMVDTPRSARQVTLAAQVAGQGLVEVTVADNGTGIAPERLGRIFESFYTEKAHGMGLGLSVCRTIVGAHGGELWAENKEPRGAVFHVRLPTVPA